MSGTRDQVTGVGYRARRSYLTAVATVTIATGLNWLVSRWLTTTDLAMVYLLGVVITAVYCERNVSLVCALFSFAAFDFFFVPPIFTLRFAQSQYLLTGLILLLVGLVISALAARAKRETQLAAQASFAAAEEKLRNSILASISHDLRTPLAVIAGSATSLCDNRDKLSIAEQDQLLKAIFEQARVMNREIANVLEIARLHASPVPLDRQWYPIEELIGAALERCKTRLLDHHLVVQLSVGVPMIRVDGVLVEKLLVNLIENAAQYTSAGTTISLGARRNDDWVELWVRDNGPGLPVSAEHLFKALSRGHKENATSGPGLGLSICRAITDLHCATITARVADEGGAEFVIRFPYEVPPEAATEEMP